MQCNKASIFYFYSHTFLELDRDYLRIHFAGSEAADREIEWEQKFDPFFDWSIENVLEDNSDLWKGDEVNWDGW